MSSLKYIINTGWSLNCKCPIISAMWHIKINDCNNPTNTNYFVTNFTTRHTVHSDSPFFFLFFFPVGQSLTTGVKFVIKFFVSHSIIEMTVLDILNTTSATIDNNVGTPYSRNDVQPCPFEKKNKFVAVLHHFHDHYSQGFEALSITSCFMFLNLSTYQTPTVESIKISCRHETHISYCTWLYTYMGHIDVLGCKNINSVILKQLPQ